MNSSEPMCWWTDEDKRRFGETLLVWERDGYRYFHSPAHGNIYGEPFTFKERIQ